MAIEYNPYDRKLAMDPYPLYARLRDEAPVFHNPEMRFWALTRYDDVVAAHGDIETFSSAGGVTIEGHEASQPLLIVQDQPDHIWAKGLVIRLFRRQRIEELAVFVRRRAVELLEQAAEEAGDNEFDFVSKFAVQLPLEVISELLGIPEEYREEIHVHSTATALRGDDRNPEDARRAHLRLIEIYLTLVRERRANPGEDVISQLLAGEVEDEAGVKHRLSDHEVAIRFLEMGLAGHETVAKAIPNGAMALQRFPDQHRLLRENRALLPKASDEMLRYDPPSQLQGRTTTREVELHGVKIPKGEKVMLVTGSATRDPRAFENPDIFDVERDLDHKSVFFGFGIHKCLGQHLARQEITIAFDELFSRFPDFEVDPDRVQRVVLSNVRGVVGLPIRLGRHA